jgi:hypothetical protein
MTATDDFGNVIELGRELGEFFSPWMQRQWHLYGSRVPL